MPLYNSITDQFQLSCTPVTLSEVQSHSTGIKLEHNGVYHHIKFEKNQCVNVQIQAKVFFFFFTWFDEIKSTGCSSDQDRFTLHCSIQSSWELGTNNFWLSCKAVTLNQGQGHSCQNVGYSKQYVQYYQVSTKSIHRHMHVFQFSGGFLTFFFRHSQ